MLAVPRQRPHLEPRDTNARENFRGLRPASSSCQVYTEEKLGRHRVR